MSGGGGGDGGATERQEKIEQQKAAARAKLNTLFGVGDDTTSKANAASRDQLYQQVRDGAFDAGRRSLDEANEVARRQNKFALFAQGLNAGSEDIDQNALLDRTYNKGILDLGAKADSAESQLRSNDETSRLGLLQAINSGTDQASAISSAINQLKNNVDSANADAKSTSLGDLFATSGALYTQSQAAKGKQAATDWWNQFTSSGTGKSNSTARSGMSSSSY